MKFRFNYKNEVREIEVDICDNIFSQARGLMFRKKSKPLLFVFRGKKKRAIHSFFCKPFHVIWFEGDEVVGEGMVRDWRLNIRCSGKFDKMLEVPLDCEESGIFVDGKRNI